MLFVRAFTFVGKKTAGKALDTIEDETNVPLWLDDVAVISRSKHGFIKVNSTWAQNDEATAGTAGFGAITGGLIGALMGPQGAVAGAIAGGTMFGMVGLGVDIALEDPRLEEFAARLKDDSSALVLVADEITAADFVSVLEPFDGELIETEMNEHDVKALREAIKADKARA